MAQARVALVTGGAGGMMHGVCISLARRGMTIAVNHRPGGTSADATVAAVRAAGATADAFAADVSNAEGAQRLVADVNRSLGRLDVLVCGAGPLLIKDVIESTADDYRAMVDGNLGSVVFCATAALPGMRERKFGRIIAFGITGSEFTMGHRHYAIHAAVKSAVVAFVKSLALEEGPHGITCNAICPGDIRDKQVTREQAIARSEYRNPTMRPGSWEDIGDAVAFLASDEASFVNGAVLAVNGGWQGFFAKHSRWP